MDKIYINYDEVYLKTKEIQEHIDNSLLPSLENEYGKIFEMLDTLDGATNETLKETVYNNKEKAKIVSSTLHKILSFMHNSSKEMQKEEDNIANQITSKVGEV